MAFSKQQVKSTLLSKFQFEEVPGTKHEAVALIYGGKKVATTRFSRGAKKGVGDSLLSVMAKEVRVNNLKFFKDMIGCKNSWDDYIKMLRDNGSI